MFPFPVVKEENKKPKKNGLEKPPKPIKEKEKEKEKSKDGTIPCNW